MKAIIIGATGTIGKAVSAFFKQAGYETLEASRKSNPAIDIDDQESVKKFFSAVDPADVIICAAGNASFGELYKLSEADLQATVNSKLLGQVRVVQQGVNKLNPDGTIVITGGMLAYSPWPSTSAVAMVNAGLEGFVKGAALDIGEGKKVMIVHPPLLAETAKMMGMDTDKWPPASSVAAIYFQAVKSTENGTAVFMEGFQP